MGCGTRLASNGIPHAPNMLPLCSTYVFVESVHPPRYVWYYLWITTNYALLCSNAGQLFLDFGCYAGTNP